ncbi:hypothetical protein GARC_4096 [Paraglaciecola arctica BSs20135]|uniref:Uncharacterized protein n=1 Tax=Paraglaciecola arctica BSs20135 TaxID=493475 RepID=K6YWD4_9ALTE|nr:hypothetical protein GARC_4096 [Paraglaciecola arctica BSs20135]
MQLNILNFLGEGELMYREKDNKRPQNSLKEKCRKPKD